MATATYRINCVCFLVLVTMYVILRVIRDAYYFKLPQKLLNVLAVAIEN